MFRKTYIETTDGLLYFITPLNGYIILFLYCQKHTNLAYGAHPAQTVQSYSDSKIRHIFARDKTRLCISKIHELVKRKVLAKKSTTCSFL